MIKAYTIAGAVLCCFAGDGHAQTKYPVLSVDASPTSVTIGEPVNVTLKITAPEMARVTVHEPFKADDSLSTWALRSRNVSPDTKASGGEAVRQINYTLSSFVTGELPLPPIEVSYQPSTGAGTTVTAPAKSIIVNSLLPSDQATVAPHDIKPPFELPFPRWIIVLVVVLAGLLFALLVKAYWSLIRRKVAHFVAPPRRIDEWAISELSVLERDRLIEKKLYREYYTRLTDIVRGYVGKLYSINALDLTTTELLWKLESDTAADDDLRHRLSDLLDEADLVKFARHTPETATARRALDSARNIILSTQALLAPVDAANIKKPSSGAVSVPPPPAGGVRT